MSFKILAIRPLEECFDDIRNNLEKNVFYFFDDAYEQDGDLDFIKKKENYNELGSEFFYRKNSDSETTLESIDIQAIVGKNGSGKSSIIEFLLRILNNFFKQYKLGSSTEKLIYSKGLVGELYFLHNENIYKIKVDSLKLDATKDSIKIELYKNREICFTSEHLTTDNNYRSELMPLEALFYSMYINYSLYGLDEEDYFEESLFTNEQCLEIEKKRLSEKSSWITSVLHKNDGYQTPLLLHPYREFGMIDARRERMLINQRLASLLFTDENYRGILPNYYFTHITLSPKDNRLSKFINDNILSIKNKNSITLDVLKLLVDWNKEGLIQSKITSLYKYIRKNNLFFNTLKDHIDEYRIQNTLNVNEIGNYLLNCYYLISDRNNIRLPIHRANEIKIDELNYIPDTKNFKKDDSDGLLAILNNTLDNLESIEYLQKKLNDDTDLNGELKYVFDRLYFLSFSQFKEFDFIRSMFNFWRKKLNISNDEEFKSKINSSQLKKDLFWYLVIKSFKIKHYSRFSPNELDSTITEEFKRPLKEHLAYERIKKRFFLDLQGDNSHITLKIKQCEILLNLFLNNKASELENYYLKAYDNYGDKATRYSLNDIGKAIETAMEGNSYEINQLIPPSTFHFSFLSNKRKDGVEKEVLVDIDKISSGQYQKMGLLTSIVYHLKNLDSVPEILNEIEIDKKSYSYKNVLIILDEIELYFHPEQQKQFIYDFLKILQLSIFKNIQNISVMCITHSPFILSDIPSQNVLKLEEGKVVVGNEINSFGANIHDLLADEFFLEKGFMGDFAEKKINDFIVMLNWKILYENFIDLIADLQDNDKQKKYVDNFELPYSGKKMEDLEFKKLIEENRELKKIWLSKQDIEIFLPIKESKVTNIANYINSLKDEILLFINTIGEPLIKLRLIEMFNDSFRPNEQTELERLLKERDILSKKIEKLESK